MKRILTFALILCIMSTMIVPVFASDNNVSEVATLAPSASSETAMPKLSSVADSLLMVENTMNDSIRREWVANTKLMLESSYDQQIAQICEDQNYITFWFEPNTSALHIQPVNDEILDAEPECVDGQLLKIAYIKPESVYAGSNMNTKIEYWWGWADGYVHIDSSPSVGTAFNVASTVILALLSNKTTTLTSILLSGLQLSASEFISAYGSQRPVRGETFANYYYMNKIAYAYVNGSWLPGCEIGSRRGFNGSLSGYRTDAGQWIMDGWKRPDDGVPESDPRNYDSIDKKKHFDDDSWMINQAITYYTVPDTELYADIYASVFNKLK